MLSGMLRVLIVGLVLLVAVMLARPRPGAAVESATVFPEGLPVPQIALTDQAGREFTLEDFRGRFTWLFFGFTNCPDICPLTLQVLADARAQVVARNAALDPQVVFVSVDPSRDSPERIAAYLRSFDPDFRGVTAPDAALAPLLAKLGVTVEQHAHGADSYNVVHNPHVYLIGPDATWIAVSSTPHVAATLASDYVKIRRRYRAPKKS
jgi:protein SCO1/2